MDELAQAQTEELRFAVVMTGGVSLAVWMGGVANELNRLRRSDGIYGGILELLGATARIDVISGTSAGGLNGAFLATAMVHERGLEGLRSVWIDDGSLDKLLRSPFQSNTTSLLKGDEYFLPKIKAALENLVGASPVASTPDEEPLRLMMTTSLISARSHAFVDGLGNVIHDIDHLGRFEFSRGVNANHHDHSKCPASRGPSAIGYAEHRIAFSTSDDFRDPLILHRLALAARASASFPLAFEPTFCPIDEATTNPSRPDMRCYANFGSSRFALDGGVLMNKPIAPALEAIYEQEASSQVRRVLLYVVPDPGLSISDVPDHAGDVVPIVKVAVEAAISLPRSESVARDLEEIKARNRRSRSRRRVRSLLLDDYFEGDPIRRAAQLQSAAERAYGSYRTIRAKTSAADIVDQLAKGLDPASGAGGTELWNRGLLEQVLVSNRLDQMVTEFSEDPFDGGISPWRWGFLSVEKIGDLVMDILDRSLTVGPGNAVDARAEVNQSLARLHGRLGEFRELRAQTGRAFWTSRAEGLSTLLTPSTPYSDLDEWARDSFEEWAGSNNNDVIVTLGVLASEIAKVIVHVRSPIEALLDERYEWERREAEQLRRMLSTLTVVAAEEDAGSACLRRLLAVDIVESVLAGDVTGVDQEVHLVQISADAPNAFDERQHPLEKLAGLQLGHFGAFYKSSWRANDWMWGRLDGAFRLVQVLLSPARIRQVYFGEAPRFLDAIEALIEPTGSAGWNRANAEAELDFLTDQFVPLPSNLPSCSRALATVIQMGIIRHEMIEIGSTIGIDEKARAYETPQARQLADEVEQARGRADENGDLQAEDAVALFRKCDIGSERISQEVGSDLFTSRVTSAAAVSVAAVSGSHSGLGPIATLIGLTRGLLLGIYALAASAVRGARTGFALQVLLLGGGTALVLIARASPESHAKMLNAGVVLIAIGLIYLLIAARARLRLALVVTTIGIGAVIAVSLLGNASSGPNDPFWRRWLEEIQPWFDALRPVLILGVIMGGLLLIRPNPKSPRTPIRSVSLAWFIRQYAASNPGGMPPEDVRLLARLDFPIGCRPRSPERWAAIYDAIKGVLPEQDTVQE